MVNQNTPVYQIVDGMVKSMDGSYGYISSTQAGKLFNDAGFTEAVRDILVEPSLKNRRNNLIFNGTNASGTIQFSDGTSVQAFNDFFSENYINNLTCSNVQTLLSGDYTLNCFGRTEFLRILENDAIKTINGIDKNVFIDLYCVAPPGQEMPYICDVLRATEISALQGKYYRITSAGIEIVGKEAEGAISLIDTLISGEKIASESTKTIDDILAMFGEGLPAETQSALKTISNSSNRSLLEILANDSEAILDMAGKDSLEIGKFTIAKGEPLVETLADGTSVFAEVPEISTADGAIAEGYKPVEGTNGKLFTISKGGIIKVLNIVGGTLVVIDATKTFVGAGLEYANGNYRTGSKELISYATAMLTSLEGCSIFTAAVETVCAMAGAVVCAPVTIFAGIAGCIVGAVWGEEIGDFLGDLVCELFHYEDTAYTEARSAVRYIADPLVLDLDGDGFELLSVNDGVYFDEDAQGLVEKTEWVAPDDALLAIDLNEDGVINDGSELFGTSTKLPDGSVAKSGFEALAQYDDNKDGVIDENDAVFNRLKVWQDKNSDGISQEDELYSLSDLEIDGICIDTSDTDGVRTAVVRYADGSSKKIGEFHFDAQLYNTIEKGKVNISDGIAGLPNVQAIGNTASLHTLMQTDETGVLRGYVEQFAKASTQGEKEQLMTDILYFISGAREMAPESRGNQIDARKLAVIEQFLGKEFIGTDGVNPVNTAASILEDMYLDIFNGYYSLLNVQTEFANYLSMTFWTQDAEGKRYLNTDVFDAFVTMCVEQGYDMKGTVVDMARVVSSLNASNSNNFTKYLLGYSSLPDYTRAVASACINHVYFGNDADGNYTGNSYSEVFFGGAGRNLLWGKCGDDILFGEAGNDELYGETGNDILVGGVGDDYLCGGLGDDTYVFHIGDGNDTIYDFEKSDVNGKADKILFGKGISIDSIKLERSGTNLVIRYGAGDCVTVKQAFAGGNYFVENIEFADGSSLSAQDIAVRVNCLHGTDGNDTLNGYSATAGYDISETFYAGAGNDTVNGYDGDDTIYGEDGDDKLYGGNGDDALIGGSGNDYLNGGKGNDTYVFHIGDGNDRIVDCENSAVNGRADRIVFGKGISADSISLERSGLHLVIRYGEGDSVTVEQAYNGSDGRYFVENIEFADGSSLSTQDIAVRANHLCGTDGNDTINGYGAMSTYDSNETIHAGAGNDTVYANDGDDIIYGEDGDDKLYGGNGDDVLIGGSGNDYLNGGNGNDTYIFHIGDGNDKIVDCENSAVNGRADRIVFGEGISADSISLERSGLHLVIHYGEEDSVTVEQAYNGSDGRYHVENVEFADGGSATIDYENAALNLTSPEEYMEVITGSVKLETAESSENYIEAAGTGSPAGVDFNVDNMVNLLIQDMSECMTGTAADFERESNLNQADDVVQLWVS